MHTTTALQLTKLTVINPILCKFFCKNNAHETNSFLKISYSTHVCLVQLERHKACKPVMVSVVSSNPTGGNFIFLRQLNANFVQKCQKCQNCVIYENHECSSYHLSLSPQTFPISLHFFSPEIAFVTKEAKGVTDTIDFPLLAKYLGIIPKSKICLDPDQSISFHIKEIKVMFPEN